MNILILDDSLPRLKTFLSHHPDAVLVTTAADCIALLPRGWDLVCLDHDLGEGDGDGMEVAHWIAENRPVIGQIVIHSLNHPAAAQMAAKMADYEVVVYPFAWRQI